MLDLDFTDATFREVGFHLMDLAGMELPESPDLVDPLIVRDLIDRAVHACA